MYYGYRFPDNEKKKNVVDTNNTHLQKIKESRVTVTLLSEEEARLSSDG